MTQEKLKISIIEFEKSSRTYQDYIQLFFIVRDAFKQGSGLDGYEINNALLEAIEEIKNFRREN